MTMGVAFLPLGTANLRPGERATLRATVTHACALDSVGLNAGAVHAGCTLSIWQRTADGEARRLLLPGDVVGVDVERPADRLARMLPWISRRWRRPVFVAPLARIVLAPHGVVA